MSKKGKTIEIDDSGTGDLIGDAFIGFHIVETGKIIFKSVPVGLYNKENLRKNAPKKKILELVQEGLSDLEYDKDRDKIKLCRGDCFDLVRSYFEEMGITYDPSAIEGKLQDAVEGRFVSHLRKLGVTSRRLTKKSGAKRYFVLFNWLSRDFPNREKYVKSGFKRWRSVWRERAIKKYNNQKIRKQF
ncbi:MAG: hypothetical protein GF311_11140 [Candidatus Lokiarchaeota archaeon]|nr:hypothetical protein [Candidatus Lokiarchaeota archaeon]MBD3213152.1 hypothetical protein [Candidatus Lokiarchaeota archaeon]